MVDRTRIKNLPDYKAILKLGYRDRSGKIQIKKGAFRFIPESYTESTIDYPGLYDLKYYNITSTGTVRGTKGAGSRTLTTINLDLKGYENGLSAILTDIKKFKLKLKTRRENRWAKDKYIESIKNSSMEIKKRIMRKYIIITNFQELDYRTHWNEQLKLLIASLDLESSLDRKLDMIDVKTIKKLSK